jgi:hypothetical protein
MAFQATIVSIAPVPVDTGVAYQVTVTFADSISGFTSTKTYNFPVNTTQAAAVAAITADGQSMKTAIAGAGNLQAKVGSVITI